MCDHHHLPSQSSLGEIDHVNFLSDNIGTLFMQEDYSDVTLVVENQRFPVHKVVLAARSDYFRALLFGGLKESRNQQTEIELQDTPSSGFHHLLKYIYTGRINLDELKEEVLLEVLGLAHKYGFLDLQTAMSEFLKKKLNIANVCLIFDMASMYSLRGLCDKCCEFMDQNAADILQSESFLTLSVSALQELISRDSFCAPEIDIFKAVQTWVEHNGDVELAKSAIAAIRFQLISLDDLLNVVRASSLVSADTILDAIKVKTESRDMELNYRGFLMPEENVAAIRHGAQVLHGEMKSSLLDGDVTSYDLDRGFSRHPIDDNHGQGIVVKLGMPCIINTVQMLLWDRDMRSYSYYIEASLDDKDWVRLVDHSKYLCRSWQNLRFPARVVRYVRVVGTHNTVNRVFHLVSLECSFSSKLCSLKDGILVPTENVATVEKSACVIEGVSRSRNALLNGDTRNYDWDSGYTCHQLGSGAIVVQLAQPYIIGSMRLLLWDCDGRCYSYYVEVSNDQQRWTRVADKTQEACRSWQTIVFEKRPITFIKIVGTHNTANEVFHCVHFECPADTAALAEYEKQHPHRQAAVSMELVPVIPNDLRIVTPRSGQQENMRLQGLGGIREEGAVDHGDGYGIGLLGGSGSPAFFPQHH